MASGKGALEMDLPPGKYQVSLGNLKGYRIQNTIINNPITHSSRSIKPKTKKIIIAIKPGKETNIEIFYKSKIKNISLSGAFIQSRNAFPVGLEISQSFFFPNFEIPIQSKSKVVWTSPNGFGIKFNIIENEK